MIAPQMLGQVVAPCEAVQTRAATPVVGAIYVFLFVCRFDVSVDVRFAAERARIAVPVIAVWVDAIVPFLRVPVRVVCQFGGGSVWGENAHEVDQVDRSSSPLAFLLAFFGVRLWGLLTYKAMLVGGLTELHI